MPNGAPKEMTGLRKAATLMVMLGPQKAADVLSACRFPRAETERLAAEMAQVQRVDEATRIALGEQLKQIWTAGHSLGGGGLRFAEDVLSRAYGADAAADIVERVGPRGPAGLLSHLANLGTPQLLEALRGEQPQAIAILLRYLPRQKAGEILSGLSDDLRVEVVMRLVRAKEPSTEALKRIENSLREKAMTAAASDPGTTQSKTAGARALAEILNQADPGVETSLLEALTQRDEELGKQVRESMFVFEDLVHLEPRQLQIILREVESSDLSLALKGAPEEIKNAVTQNLSENAAAALKEDLEAMGPVRRRDIYAARQRILSVLRTLSDDGKINLRQDEEEMVA
jgi:flagellar motor switch protein FliG